MYMHTEEESGFGHVQRQQFNLYWMTNQPYLTGQELTGNQCIQPPILHQYSVSHSCHRPAHLAVFLPLLFHFSFFLSIFSGCVSAVCFFESHSISILRTSLFRCFVFKWSDSQAGGCSSEGELVGRRSGKRGGEQAFGVGFLLTVMVWGDDSWRNALLISLMRVTWPLGWLTLQSNLNEVWVVRGEKNVHL